MSVAGCERRSRGAGAACKHGQLLALRTAARQPCCRTPTGLRVTSPTVFYTGSHHYRPQPLYRSQITRDIKVRRM